MNVNYKKIMGVNSMEYEVQTLEEMNVIGYLSKFATMQDAQQGLPKAWQAFNENGQDKTLAALSNHKLDGFLGVIVPTESGMNYLIAVTSDKKSEAGLHPYTLPAGKYVVADAKGPVPEAIQRVCEKVYTPHYLSELGFKMRQAPGIEFYPHGNPMADDYAAKVYVPVEE